MKTKAFHSSVLVMLAVVGTVGCTAGGPDSPPAPPVPPPPPAVPVIQVLPGDYDFGKVTSNNDPAPLEISIGNAGNGPLTIKGIALAAADPNFQLKLNGGAAPCGSLTPTIAPGTRCTVQVAFDPQSNGAFATTLQITSNGSSTPVSVPIKGGSEAISTLIVRVNQIQRTCPSNALTAYVSVTDQGGYAVTGLTSSAFSATQGAAPPVSLPVQASHVEVAYQPIATAAALDYSNSLTSQSVAFADMKNGFVGYFNGMRTDQGDKGAVVKFGSEVEVTQAFTSDKAALQAAINATFDKGASTRLYDAAIRAADDAATEANGRKVAIIATDGRDTGSARTLVEATSNAVAKGVPLFTIGIGGSIDNPILKTMATDTGGLYYEANTSQNLATIYQQLSSILFRNQYVLRFDQQPGAGSALAIGASLAGPTPLTGSASSTIPACSN